MSDVAIHVDKLAKRYRIGEGVASYGRLTESISNLVKAPLRWLRGDYPLNNNKESDHIWALRDVCLEVGRGEAIGIIGRNGAGKSTLLKVLSRIVEPTEGYAEIAGRVASLLEVGTGFHPELSGRENIFLNGAILGMTRSEIRRKFDEIVSFAEVEKFIDTPMKRYSTGMFVRLAFSVAAHLEPQILLVDEVLSVGDAGFQRRCLGKMEGVARQGRTILFVSHDMSAITKLCTRVIELDGGRCVAEGEPDEVVGGYLAKFDRRDFALEASKYLLRAELEKQGAAGRIVRFGECLTLRFQMIFPPTLSSPAMSINITDNRGIRVLHLTPFDGSPELHLSGVVELVCTIPEVRLNVGRYWCNVNVGEGVGRNRIELIERAVGFEVVPSEKLIRHWPPHPDDALWVPDSWWTIKPLEGPTS